MVVQGSYIPSPSRNLLANPLPLSKCYYSPAPLPSQSTNATHRLLQCWHQNCFVKPLSPPGYWWPLCHFQGKKWNNKLTKSIVNACNSLARCAFSLNEPIVRRHRPRHLDRGVDDWIVTPLPGAGHGRGLLCCQRLVHWAVACLALVAAAAPIGAVAVRGLIAAGVVSAVQSREHTAAGRQGRAGDSSSRCVLLGRKS